MSEELIDRQFAASKDFFSLPLSSKLKLKVRRLLPDFTLRLLWVLRLVCGPTPRWKALYCWDVEASTLCRLIRATAATTHLEWGAQRILSLRRIVRKPSMLMVCQSFHKIGCTRPGGRGNHDGQLAGMYMLY